MDWDWGLHFWLPLGIQDELMRGWDEIPYLGAWIHLFKRKWRYSNVCHGRFLTHSHTMFDWWCHEILEYVYVHIYIYIYVYIVYIHIHIHTCIYIYIKNPQYIPLKSHSNPMKPCSYENSRSNLMKHRISLIPTWKASKILRGYFCKASSSKP